MIIYENNIRNFIEECDNKTIASSVANKMHLLNVPHTQNEEKSWENSLPYVGNVLNSDDIDKDINIAIEYRSQISKNRMDCIVYGKDDNDRLSLVIIELKQWSQASSSNKPNCVYTVGYHGIEDDYQHPSYQALRYKSMMESFNEYVQDNDVDIESCSYCHNLDNIYDFVVNSKKDYPFVETSPIYLKDDATKLREFIKKYVKKPCRQLLYTIENSKIRPTKEFSNLFYNALKGEPIFSLDDGQSESVATIVKEVNTALEKDKRKTIIIKGGPGTGKSVVAINAMGMLLHPKDRSEPKNVCYCTANFTPKELYSELLVDNNYKKVAISNLFKNLATFSRSKDCEFDCVFYDEAHRMFKWKFGQGVKKDVDMTERAFQASRVNVWFIDEDQVVTKDDYLTIDKIKKYAKKFNSEVIESDDLKLTTQFRCTGGQNYINLINTFLGYDNSYNKKMKLNNYDFKVCDSATEMYEKIKAHQKQYKNARVLSGYTYEWVTKTNPDPNLYDIVLDNGNFKMKWNKAVSVSFILDETQLDRVGCIHTIQGVDMSYAGVIIGKDIIYRDGKIIFDKTQNAKTDHASGIRKADYELAKKLIRNTYKVLLTRGMYGTYVYCEDKELNDYFKSLV